MRGKELAAWRERMGFSQLDLMKELGVKSRQTISSWENSDAVPRIVELAVISLERDPGLRLFAGEAASPREGRRYFRNREATR